MIKHDINVKTNTGVLQYIHLIATKKNYLKKAWAHMRINEKKHFLKSSASAQQEGGREGAHNIWQWWSQNAFPKKMQNQNE